MREETKKLLKWFGIIGILQLFDIITTAILTNLYGIGGELNPITALSYYWLGYFGFVIKTIFSLIIIFLLLKLSTLRIVKKRYGLYIFYIAVTYLVITKILVVLNNSLIMFGFGDTYIRLLIKNILEIITLPIY